MQRMPWPRDTSSQQFHKDANGLGAHNLAPLSLALLIEITRAALQGTYIWQAHGTLQQIQKIVALTHVCQAGG